MSCRTAVAHGLRCILLCTLLSACAGRAPETPVSVDQAKLNAAPKAPDAEAVNLQLHALLPADVLLLGEQHDAPAHQQLQRAVVLALAARGTLAALALEMADRNTSTAGLPPQATEEQVRAALKWRETGWPWDAYGPAVMAAVQAGVPVIGANLPAGEMKDAMKNIALDGHLTVDKWKKQQEIIREGHCGLLPPSQIVPMTRIQTARDAAMAQTIAAALQPGKTVLLIAGNGHVDLELGVPTHLSREVRSKSLVLRPDRGSGTDADTTPADAVWLTAAPPPKDYCAELRQQMAPGR